MNLQTNLHEDGLARRPSPLGRLAVAIAGLAALGCLAFGPNSLRAADGGPMSAGGGGDAIGSLPFNVAPPEGLAAPVIPSIVIEGPNLAVIDAVVVDAWGDGYAEISETETGVRIELQGAVQLLVDRHLLAIAPVSFSYDVSQGFSGGLGALVRDQHLISSQILPAAGDLELPLASLAESGVLDQGGLSLHLYSVQRKHHVLDLTGSGGTVRLSSHP